MHFVYRSDKSLLEVLNTSSKDEVEKRYSDRPSVSGRLRNSLFKAALIETLGLMKNDNEIWTLGKQNKKIEASMSGPRGPPSPVPDITSSNGLRFQRGKIDVGHAEPGLR